MTQEVKDPWREMFTIEPVVAKFDPYNNGRLLTREEYLLKDLHGNERGRYRDRVYAVKQARRKYKKAIRQMEKALALR